MIIDAASIPDAEEIEADLCIVGAGPAGLTLARKLIGTPYRVYVLESGGEHLNEQSRESAEGESVGHPYFPLRDSRSRVFGGSSYIWEEWFRTRPLDPIDYEARPWVPASGWPFAAEKLDRFLPEAHNWLELGPMTYDPKKWAGTDLLSSLGMGENMHARLFRYSNTSDFTTWRDRLDASANVCVVLNANVLELAPDESLSSIRNVTASSSLPQRFRVNARVFVLAAGGIDNPRLLLLSRGRTRRGLGNDNDLVGRYFMEHPTVRSGYVVPRGDLVGFPPEVHEMRSVDGLFGRLAFAPTPETMRRRQILNGMTLLSPSSALRASEVFRSMALLRDPGSTAESVAGHMAAVGRHPIRALNVLRSRRKGPEAPLEVYTLALTIEQAPNPHSRVSLGNRLDRFGLPNARLDWQLTDLERRTVRVIQESLDAELRRLGVGEVRGFLGEEFPPRAFRGEWHQMGTTRMSDDPKQGVVDRDGRVHGISNLYVAGSSVFPTVGYANPTLTIVALTLRLAENVDEVLSAHRSLGPIW